MDRELLQGLNKQLNQELRNAYLYLSMAAYFDKQGLAGFVNFFKVQAEEELEHGMRIFNYLSDRGEPVELYDIPAPQKDFKDIVDAVKTFYESEKENTKKIWELVDSSRKAGDKATENFLQWFVEEQVEEEKLARDLLFKVKLVGESPSGLLALDRALSERKKK